MSLPADTLLWKIGKKWVSPLVNKFYHLEFFGKIPKPPFLLICNHVNPIDPFFIAPFVDIPISWVIAQISFQNPFERFFLKKIGAIQKFKSRPDPAMLYSIYNILNHGGVVGLFPEGTITWTGDFQNHLISPKSMNKLILSLDIPIVAACIQGAWLSHPVWADNGRKSKIFIHFKTFSDYSAMESIHHSEWEWQKKHLIPYPGKRKAQGIERVLWICPHCSSFHTLVGRWEEVFCSSCRNHWFIDDFGFIGGRTLPDLFHHQIEVFSHLLHDLPKVTFPSVKVSIRNDRTTSLIKTFHQRLTIENDVIQIGSMPMNILKMKGVNTHFRDILEFRYEDTLVRIKSRYTSFLLYNWIEIRKKQIFGQSANETYV
ncbi:MAG: 1-acyl-sn-glycerol-3-phosphate acyltransferase [Candidatus Atribacteria bacterium]|nr:1-acyl-sn-glycerol-3-phosphate acyltransferase [Candidatus Atribacteria bacterium]